MRWAVAGDAAATACGPVQKQLLFGLGLQFGVVLGDERTNFVGHREQLRPLLFVERDGKAAETVDRHASLLADPESEPPAALCLETLVLRSEPLELRFQFIVGHAWPRLIGA